MESLLLLLSLFLIGFGAQSLLARRLLPAWSLIVAGLAAPIAVVFVVCVGVTCVPGTWAADWDAARTLFGQLSWIRDSLILTLAAREYLRACRVEPRCRLDRYAEDRRIAPAIGWFFLAGIYGVVATLLSDVTVDSWASGERLWRKFAIGQLGYGAGQALGMVIALPALLHFAHLRTLRARVAELEANLATAMADQETLEQAKLSAGEHERLQFFKVERVRAELRDLVGHATVCDARRPSEREA